MEQSDPFQPSPADPLQPSFIPFTNQVGGHTGVRTTSTGELLVKPCLAREKEFYTTIGPRLGGEAFIGTWTPRFHGTRLLRELKGVDEGEEMKREVGVVEGKEALDEVR